jgi:hypothetical protein
MIRVHFKEPAKPEWKKWKKDCEQAVALLKTRKKPPYKVQEGLYKRCRDLLFAAYANKCAYCEGRLGEQSAALVEHFRPKAGVRDLKNKVVHVKPKVPHGGYWWLAYDASNLLPTCTMCNVYTIKRGGKGERFPLPENGFRACKPGEEKKERPLLVHPGYQEPPNFKLDFDTGALKATDERGRVCIEVFGLNREGLLEARRIAVMNATVHIRSCRGKRTPKAQLQFVDNHLSGQLPYSLVWRRVEDQMPKKGRRKRGRRSSF